MHIESLSLWETGLEIKKMCSVLFKITTNWYKLNLIRTSLYLVDLPRHVLTHSFTRPLVSGSQIINPSGNIGVIHSGHYTASINCCKNILLQRSHNYGVWNYWQQKLLYCICYTIWIDWHMIFRLEQEGRSLIAVMALVHPLHPIDNMSKNMRRNMWVGWCVSFWWPLFPSRSSVLIYIYAFSIWVLFSLVYQLCLALSDDNSLIPGCLWLLAFVLNNTRY